MASVMDKGKVGIPRWFGKWTHADGRRPWIRTGQPTREAALRWAREQEAIALAKLAAQDGALVPDGAERARVSAEIGALYRVTGSLQGLAAFAADGALVLAIGSQSLRLILEPIISAPSDAPGIWPAAGWEE